MLAKKCKFIIKLPNGGNIEIPTSFGNITETDEIKLAISNLGSFSEEDITSYFNTKGNEKLKKDIKELVNILYEITPSEFKKSDIQKLIENSLKNNKLDNLISELNSNINDLGNTDNLEKAVLEFIKIEKGGASSLLKKLDSKVTPKYFKDIESLNIIGRTNIKYELDRIEKAKIQNDEYGFNDTLNINLLNFLKSLSNIFDIDKNLLLPLNNSLVQDNTFNFNDFTFYKKDDNLSLFLALLKKVGSKLNIDDIKNKLGSTDFNFENISSEKFFNGYFDGNVFVEGEFLKILKYSKYKKYLNKILNLIDSYIRNSDTTKNNSVFNEMEYLFSQLNPEIYGNKWFSKQEAERMFVENELRQEISIKNKIAAEKISILKNEHDLDELYAQKEVIKDNFYEKANSILVKRQDLIKFNPSWSKTGIYYIITDIKPVDNGVKITGARIGSDSKLEERSEIYNEKNNTIEYRKYEGLLNPFTTDNIKVNDDVIKVFSEEGFSQSIIKQLVRKGSIINGRFLVLAVNPGHLLLKSLNESNKKVPFKYSNYKNIKSFTSSIAKHDIENIEKINIREYTPITSGKLLSVGDIFEDEGRKRRVLYTNDNYVYYIFTDANGNNGIKTANKEDIKKGFIHSFKQLTSKEIEEINKEINLSLDKTKSSKKSYSSFFNTDKAQKNDYYYYKEDGNIVIGKVVDDNKGIVFKNDKLLPEQFKNKPNIQFFTKRDISSEFAYTISRINNWKVDLLPENKDLVEVLYIIPIDMDEDQITLLGNNYGSFGRYITKDFNYDKNLYKDVTYKILELLKNREGSINNKKLYVKETDKNFYERNLTGLIRISNFEKLTADVKNKTGAIKPGVYFSIYKNDTKLNQNIYRVINVNNQKVIAHLNKVLENGNILTIEEEFDLSKLLSNDKSGDSLSALYLQYGNSKIEGLIEIASENLISAEEAEVKMQGSRLRSNIIKSFIPLFDAFNIPLEVSDKNFEIGQKARIEVGVDKDDNIFKKVVLSKSIGKADDLIHEVLHLFLIPLRYVNPEDYFNLLESLENPKIDMEEDINKKEELFVELVSKAMLNDADIRNSYGEEINTEKFINIMMNSIKLINKDFDKNKYSLLNPADLLKTPLYKVLGLKINNSITHKMYNMGLIYGEPMMRKWMSENNITLKC